MRKQSPLGFFGLVWDFFRSFLFSRRAGAVVRYISWITIFGIGVSLTALVVVLSVMSALNDYIRERTLAVQPHLKIQLEEEGRGAFAKGLENHPILETLRSQAPRLQWKWGLYESQDVILRTVEGHFHGAVARGLTPEILHFVMSEVDRIRSKQGNQGLSQNWEIHGKEVIMGVDLARSLGVFEGDSIMVLSPDQIALPVGENVQFERVTIRRIMSTSLSDVDGQSIFYLRGQALRRLKENSSLQVGVDIWTQNSSRVEGYRKLLLSAIQKGSVLGPGLKISTWREMNTALFFALQMERFIMTIFLSLAIIVASFSILSVLSLLITQKVKEIGILQVIGFSRRGVRGLFTGMGLSLSLLGVGGGGILGSILSLYLEKYPLAVLPDIYYDSHIPARWDASAISIILVLSLGLCLGGLVAASRHVTRIDPSQALRN